MNNYILHCQNCDYLETGYCNEQDFDIKINHFKHHLTDDYAPHICLYEHERKTELIIKGNFKYFIVYKE